MRISPTSPPKGTLRDWLDYRADTTPNDISHIFTPIHSELTWASLRDKARDIAMSLTVMGIDKGQSIALCQPNNHNAIVTLFGILYGGFRATPLNLAAGPAALGHAISHSKASHVFIDQSQTDVLAAALAQTDASPQQIVVDSNINLPSVDKDASISLHEITPQDHALLMYTSGTTGLPKGVVHTQSSLLAGGWTTAVAHQLSDKDRAYCVLPFFHINGLCVTLIAPLVSGGSVIVAPRFSNSRFWDDCAQHQATWFSVVPTIISHLLHSDNAPDNNTMRNIRFGRSASAPLAIETQKSFESRFQIPIIETMGLTETAAQILSNPLPPQQRKIGSPGIPFGNEIAILDTNLNPLAFGQSGEIAVKGPNVLLNYLDNPKATNDCFTPDGWMRTGDLGHQDDDGYVFVTGRLKELIIKGGENIAPREIDEALYSHGDVIEAAAFACECSTYGQRVEAAVVLDETSTTTDQDLLSICHLKLGVFKSPDIIHVLPELPKGPSGKIQRLKLAALVENQ